MNTFTKTQIKQFQKEKRQLSDKYNSNIHLLDQEERVVEALGALKQAGYKVSLTRNGKQVKLVDATKVITNKQHKDFCRKMNDWEKEIFFLILNSNQKHVALDTTFRFQSPMGNHEMDDLLEKEFPQGLADSESGCGFFYIHRDFVPEVIKFMKKHHCSDVSVDYQENEEFFTPIFKWENAK